MVTEANPNVHPQSHSPTGDKSLNNNINSTGSSSNVYFVGLEFVRQYYTVMNQGPLYLHRFYSDDSSFVHGMSARDSKVVYGQQEIHKRIQSLNFRNCHAKIRQVDSHETVGDGVVIQVTGELSNNGQPMRRFMQTFVLAPQSPKRYYVRNDIFHYQDEVFCDDDADAGSAADAAVDNEDADEQEIEEEVAVVSATPGANSLDNVINNLGLRPNAPSTASLPAGGSSPGLSNDTSSADTTPAKPEVAQGKSAGAPEPAVAAIPQVSAAVPVVEETVSVVSVTRAVEEETVVVNTGGPKTYANLFKNNTSSVTSTTTVAQAAVKTNGPSATGNMAVNVADGGLTSSPQTSPQSNAITGGKPIDKGLPPRNPRASGGFNRDRQDRDGRNDRGDRDGRQNERERREPRERLPSRSSTTHNAETGSVDGDKSRPVNTYPDANQLFVGNLPHTVTTQEIKDVFCEYGEVADIKIQKPQPKNAGNPKVPYFAFVVFEDPSSAQAVLKRPNIRMKFGDGDRRLNVEEKRSRPNTGGAGGGGYSGFNRDGSTGAGHAGVNNQGSNVGGGSGHGRGYGNYGDQRGSAPTHSRTFRGTNRGGGNQNTGGDRGGRHNTSGVNTGGFQGGRASPNRNYNNSKR